MSLRDDLNDLLPQVLPQSPEQAFWGTELVEVLRKQGVAAPEQTLRQYFSNMSRDPTSAIAKVVGGHGYYLRPTEILEAPTATPGTTPVANPAAGVAPGGRTGQREEKFRSLFMRWAQQEQQLPMHLEHTQAVRQQAGINKWKYPDVVSVKWGVLKDDGGLDKDLLQVRQGLGDQPFRIYSTELKVDVTPSSLREIFFQCVSNSRWAHGAQLAIASKISDDKVAEELKRLGTSYDVSVVSFGLSPEYLEQLPSAETLLAAPDEQIEKLLAEVRYETIASGEERDSLDWEHIRDLQNQHPAMIDFFSWIARCLKDGQAHSRAAWEMIRQ